VSDFEKMKALFTEFGIEFEVVEKEEFDNIFLDAGKKKVEGYNGFFTYFKFNKDGTFRSAGLYE